jgi:capsular exopolysaccharide synthesis family protein
LVAPSVVGIQDASLNSLVLKLTDLYNRRQIISFSAKENNPTLVLVDKEIDQIRNQLAENVRNLIANATASIDALKERQAKISSQMNRLPQKEQQMVNIQRQFTLTNDLYNFLLQKRAETNIALASTLPDVQIIDVARPETAAEIGLSSRIILIIGFLLGAALPLAYIMLVNYFDDRIRTQEDVEKFSALPVLGTIMHNPDKEELTVYKNPKTTIAESFRALRTNLHFMLPGSGAKVISIHSPNPGEGKSFVTTNLACILAMNKNKVLLIGADLRKPKLQKHFNQSNEHGLSTYLIGYDSFDQVVFPTAIENLSLLPSGPIPPNPAEILSNPEMVKLLGEAKQKFDYIVIDNAPIGLVTDGIIVSQLSDLNIFVLRYGFSHKHELEMLNQYAIKKLISNLAIVVNDIKFKILGYTYYKYYRYEDYRKTYYSAEQDQTKNGRKKKLKAS